MKTLTRTRLAWAALAVALVAGSLVAQDNDPVVQKTRLLGEAIKAREEGNLKGALEKYEQILVLDAADEAANEGKLSIKAALAEAEAIDAGMKLGCNQPIGPLALADMIGLDVCLAVMEVYLKEFGDSKYRPCPLLKELVAAGRLGRKTGHGVYQY